MTSAQVLRWGICCAARISNDFCAALKLLPESDHQIVAIAARNKDRADEFAKRFDIKTVYTSYEDLAKDETVDVVHIGSLHPYHESLCKLFINAGKNILCEKPLAMNVKECQEIINFAKEKNVFLMEGFWTRFYPLCHKIRKTVTEKQIGEVMVLDVDLGVKIPPGGRVFSKSQGGGALMDMGCYTVMYANMLFGDEKLVKITANGKLNEDGVDVLTNITLQYENGRIARLLSTNICDLEETATIFGTNGKIKSKMFWGPTEIEINGEKFIDEEFNALKSNYPMMYRKCEGFTYEAKAVRDCIHKGLKESPIMPHKDTLAIMEIMDEARRQIGVVYPADQS